MLQTPLLVLKEHVQQQLDKAVNHDLRQYAVNLHRIVNETEQQYHIKFHYAVPESLIPPTERK